MKHYMIFDTETTSINKPFAYDIGYVIIDENGTIVLKRDFIVEQIWHNIPLFSTAYFADKRPLYVSMMKGRKAIMAKCGQITQQMYRDIKDFHIEYAFAFNSSFDKGVFDFICDYFKIINPFDNVKIRDIRGFAHTIFCDTDEYKAFCEQNNLFTEYGNISTTAEACYRFITKDLTFDEAHTALDDSIIETEILMYCVRNGADFETEYVAKRSIRNKGNKNVTILFNGDEILSTDYKSMTISKDKSTITIRG